MATKKHGHRHQMERIAVRSFSKGPWLSFALGALSIAAAVFLLLNGITWPAFTIVPTGFLPSILSLIFLRDK